MSLTHPSNDHALSSAELTGFVCPECLKPWETSEQLLAHFDQSHDPKKPITTPARTGSKNPDVDLTNKTSKQRLSLFNELSKHNHTLMERVREDSKLISELQSVLDLVIGGISLPDKFIFSDKDLESRVDAFLKNQAKYATLESKLEATQMRLLDVQNGNFAETSSMGVNTDEDVVSKELLQCRGQLQLALDEITNLNVQLESAKQESLAPPPSDSKGVQVSEPQLLGLSCPVSDTSNAPVSPLCVDNFCQTDDEQRGPDEATVEREILENKLRNLQNALEAAKLTEKMHMEEKQYFEDLLANQAMDLKTQTEQVTLLQAELDGFKTQNLTLREDIRKQMDRVQELENDLAQNASAHHTQMEKRDRELRELRTSVRQLEAELQSSNSRCEQLIEQAKQLSEQAKQSELKLNTSTSELEDCKNQLTLARNESDSLLDRLMNSEDKYTTLEQQFIVQRKQLEDLNKALFELGHEHQSLQMLREKVMNRQWTKDTDAPFCVGCDREFSLSNRRHHCRNCGGVFCHSCSSNRAPTPASKDPVRVCDSCYRELSAR